MINIIKTMILFMVLIISGCTSSKALYTTDLTPESSNGIAIINILDTTTFYSDLVTGYGFTSVIRTPELNILVDTGDYDMDNPDEIILGNMKKIGISPKEIDIVFISHWHKAKGLKGFMEANPDASVYAPLEDYDADRFKDAEIDYQIIDEQWAPLSENIFSTGSVYSKSSAVYEQSLVIETEEGLIAIVSCAHPGIVEVANRIQNQFPDKDISLLMGGFHLSSISRDELPGILSELVAMGVEYMAPSHCSGAPFKDLAKEQYGDKYIDGGAGLTILF